MIGILALLLLGLASVPACDGDITFLVVILFYVGSVVKECLIGGQEDEREGLETYVG